MFYVPDGFFNFSSLFMGMALVFWISLFVVVYTYIGYGILLFLIVKIKAIFQPERSCFYNDAGLPEITLLIAAYNEEDFIEEKIKNSLLLKYPGGKLKIFVVTDGSDDRTPEIAGRYEELTHFYQPVRRGKIAAINRVMPYVQTPVVVYSDANTVLNDNALVNIVRHFRDDSVGAVAGEKRIRSEENDAASGAGEGIYWKYESMLKCWDSALHSVVGAAGELFAIRTRLYRQVPADTIIEDFYLSLSIAREGYRVVYEPQAYAVEGSSASVREELKRRIRIAAGGIQAIVRLRSLLNIFRYGILSFQYISHRVLRWTVTPFALLALFFSNFLLALGESPVYQLFFTGQVIFYLLALGGYLLEVKQIRLKLFFVPYYFFIMNYAVFAGIIRYLKGSQSVAWERAKRA